MRVLRAFSWVLFEHHLGAALIRLGRHRYRHNEAGCLMVDIFGIYAGENAKKGGTARLSESRPFDSISEGAGLFLTL